MFIDSNEKCPVCDKAFTEDDDVVICPHCGTPHHRECYNSLGHCFNAAKHKSGFEYGADSYNTDSNGNEIQQEPETENNGYYYVPSEPVVSAENKAKKVCPQCNREIDSSAPFCCYCGARQSNVQYREYSPVDSLGINNAEQQRYEGASGTIDGKSIADVAAVVRTNTARFIPKFIKNKKLSWNWSAFIFGPYYLFFRKMYKQGIIFMAVSLIVSLVGNGLFSEQLAELSSFMSANYNELFSAPTAELTNQFYEIYQKIIPYELIILGSNLIIHLIIALFSDTFYRARAIELLNKVDENLAQGGMFNMAVPMADSNALSQSDMKRLYLSKVGGTSFLSPIIAYLALYFISQIISLI